MAFIHETSFEIMVVRRRTDFFCGGFEKRIAPLSGSDPVSGGYRKIVLRRYAEHQLARDRRDAADPLYGEMGKNFIFRNHSGKK